MRLAMPREVVVGTRDRKSISPTCSNSAATNLEGRQSQRRTQESGFPALPCPTPGPGPPADVLQRDQVSVGGQLQADFGQLRDDGQGLLRLRHQPRAGQRVNGDPWGLYPCPPCWVSPSLLRGHQARAWHLLLGGLQGDLCQGARSRGVSLTLPSTLLFLV